MSDPLNLRAGCGYTFAVMTIFAAACGAGDSPDVVRYSPGASLERLQLAAVTAPEVGMIRDFDISGDTMYLLDRADVVHVLRRTADGWHKAGEIGRTGAGPGEFRNPSGLSVAPSGAIIVAEAGRLQVMRPDGTVESTHDLDLPCPMMLPMVATAAEGIFVFGNCLRRGHLTDTIKAVLMWARDREHYQIVAEEVSFTRDGLVGSIFSAQRAFTPVGGTAHLFGTGVDGCLTSVSEVPGMDAAALPTATRGCGIVRTRYTAPPPPEFGRMRARMGNFRMAWPKALPAYIDRIQAGDVTVLLRPFTADSVVLQAVEPDGRDLAVAPLNGFIACKAAGCLWLLEDTEPARMIMLETSQIQSLLAKEGR
ncbi:hypothetical protein BH23GEM10_BH23GEM10_05390 [soil metagenome]